MLCTMMKKSKLVLHKRIGLHFTLAIQNAYRSKKRDLFFLGYFKGSVNIYILLLYILCSMLGILWAINSRAGPEEGTT